MNLYENKNKRVGQDALQLELEKPGTIPGNLFVQYRRSLIYENTLSDAEILSKTENFSSTELLNLYEKQFHRLLRENKNEIQFLKKVQAAADKENEPDISLRSVLKTSDTSGFRDTGSSPTLISMIT